MIQINTWKSHSISEIKSTDATKYTVTYTNFDRFDDRSDWTSQFISNVSEIIIPVRYDPLAVILCIGEIKYPIKDSTSYRIPEGKILVDSTSLALPELLHLFSILNSAKRSFDVLYVQPTQYTESKKLGLDTVKSFDLSDDGLGIQQLPPYVGQSINSMIFFFLGWEGHRLGALINSDEFNINNITFLIGTPPFKIGWENITLSNNYKQLEEISNSTSFRFKFAGANDPVKTYELIEQIYNATSYTKQRLCLAPFGTKPATIASAQFAVNHNNVIMLYDFVKKKQNRSTGTDLIHLWEFECIDE